MSAPSRSRARRDTPPAAPEVVQANGVVWDAPPSTGRNQWERKLAPFVENPGEWGRIPETVFDNQGGASALKSRLNHRKVTIPQPDAEWEFESGSLDGKWYVWARYPVTEEEADE